jgi:hypothetical protein
LFLFKNIPHPEVLGAKAASLEGRWDGAATASFEAALRQAQDGASG